MVFGVPEGVDNVSVGGGERRHPNPVVEGRWIIVRPAAESDPTFMLDRPEARTGKGPISAMRREQMNRPGGVSKCAGRCVRNVIGVATVGRPGEYRLRIADHG